MLLRLSLLFSALAALAVASPQPAPPQLAKRDTTSCSHDNLYRCLYASPSQAAPFCNSVIGTFTITAPTVTPSTTVTSSFTQTIYTSNTVPETATSTQTVITTTTATSQVFTILTISTTTTTTTTSATLLNKRDVGTAGPSCVTKGTSYPASRLTSACSCLYTQSTVTSTPTAATVTLVSLTTSFPVSTVYVTSTTTVPFTITTITSTTTTTTATIPTTAVSTSIVPDQVSFTRVVTGGRCVYNEYTNYIGAPNDAGPNNDYATGVKFCADTCAQDPTCKFYLFYRSDPAYRNQGDNSAYCIIDNLPYNPAFLQCNVPFVLFDVAYNKV
ncbi:MAG: hypothetical protein M1829_003397 [Trizodia sp. TS-e1964]|nr:MAG: hypothetical protein M1829_003397 [Trizodia sp. TS-e1964]